MHDDLGAHLTIFVFGAAFGAALVRIIDHIKDIFETKRLERAEKGKK